MEGIGSGRAPSRTMVVKNAIAALGWTGVFLLLTHIPQIANALKMLLGLVKRGMIWLMEILLKESTS